jgi:L-lactate dehydrogenase complex protein LldG
MNSRDAILDKLRRARQPFRDLPPLAERRPVTLLPDQTLPALRARFIQEAKKVNCHVYTPASAAEALDLTLELIGSHKRILAWDADQTGLAGLGDALDRAGVAIAPANSDGVLVGVTGVNAALAATGSLVLVSGAGRPRTASLLPDRHIALVPESRLLPDLEAWFAQQRRDGLADFRAHSNTVIITGPSKTADIAQELILGAHGPRELHIVLW